MSSSRRYTTRRNLETTFRTTAPIAALAHIGVYKHWSDCASHSVTFDDGVASATQSSGSFQRTFTAVGVYPYHCAIHGAAMAGTITVQ